MRGKDIHITWRRVLLTVVIIGLASAAAGAGTMAFFSDTETSSNNNVAAGTLELGGISDGQISMTNAVPGETTNGTVNATYDGSVDAEIDINVSLNEYNSEPSEPANENLTATEFASKINVTSATATVGSGNTVELATTGYVTDTNGDGHITLDELASSGTFDAVTGTNATDGDEVSLSLDLKFWEGAGNEAQADGVNITVSLIAEQPEADN